MILQYLGDGPFRIGVFHRIIPLDRSRTDSDGQAGGRKCGDDPPEQCMRGISEEWHGPTASSKESRGSGIAPSSSERDIPLAADASLGGAVDRHVKRIQHKPDGIGERVLPAAVAREEQTDRVKPIRGHKKRSRIAGFYEGALAHKNSILLDEARRAGRIPNHYGAVYQIDRSFGLSRCPAVLHNSKTYLGIDCICAWRPVTVTRGCIAQEIERRLGDRGVDRIACGDIEIYRYVREESSYDIVRIEYALRIVQSGLQDLLTGLRVIFPGVDMVVAQCINPPGILDASTDRPRGTFLGVARGDADRHRTGEPFGAIDPDLPLGSDGRGWLHLPRRGREDLPGDDHLHRNPLQFGRNAHDTRMFGQNDDGRLAVLRDSYARTHDVRIGHQPIGVAILDLRGAADQSLECEGRCASFLAAERRNSPKVLGVPGGDEERDGEKNKAGREDFHSTRCRIHSGFPLLCMRTTCPRLTMDGLTPLIARKERRRPSISAGHSARSGALAVVGDRSLVSPWRGGRRSFRPQ